MSKIVDLLKAYDDAALEALTSKGLLRRTRKDLETVQPVVLNENDQEIVLNYEDNEVVIPVTGPSSARCSCPTSGICRHILASILYIQKNALIHVEEKDEVEAITKPAAGTGRAEVLLNEVVNELLAYSIKDLQKWAGKANLRKAIALLAEEIEVQEVQENRIILLFPSRNIRVFLIKGVGPDEWVVDGADHNHHPFVVAAILYCQKQINPETTEIPKELDPVKKVDSQFVEKTMQLLEEMVEVGLSHLSEAFSERLVTTALAAISMELPRLSLSLRSIAEEVDLIINRSAQADEARLLRLLARTYALCQALASHPEDYRLEWKGQGRTAYNQVESLDLHCVSAYRWESKSDYHGITLVFWNEQDGEWLSWSDSRPKFHTTGFDPVLRYQESAPWNLGVNLEKLAKSKLELKHPRKNHQNRLSSSEITEGRITGIVAPSSLNWHQQSFSNWKQLIAFGNDNLPIGLDVYYPLKELVVLKPTVWGRRGYDPVKQEFFWPIEDEEGATVLLRVPYNEWNEQSIATLENIDIQSEQIWGVVSRLINQNKEIYLYPLSLLSDKPESSVIHLTLDKLSDKPFVWLHKLIRNRGNIKNQDYLEQNIDEESPFPLLVPVEDLLLSLAERGCLRIMTSQEKEKLIRFTRKIREQSLPVMANAIENVGQNLAGKTILIAVYLILLHYQAFVKLPETST